MQELTNARENLAKERRKVQLLYLAHALGYVAALVLLMFHLNWAGIGVGVANMVLYFLFLRGQLKGYSAAVDAVRIRFGLCGGMTEVTTAPKGNCTQERFAALQLLPMRSAPGALLCHNGFAGKKDGVAFTGNEITLHYPYHKADGKQDYHFINGTLVTAAAPAPAQAAGDWLLIHHNLIEAGCEADFAEDCRYCPVACEALAKDYTVYSREGAAELPEYLVKRITKLAQAVPTLGALRLKQGTAAAYLYNRFYTQRTPVHTLPEESALRRNPLPERDALLAFLRSWLNGAEQ